MSNRAGLPRLLVAATALALLVGLPAATSFSYAEEPPPPDQVAVEVTESTGAESTADQAVTDEVTPAPAEAPLEVSAPAEPAAAEVIVDETTTNEATDASTDQVATEQVVEAPAEAPAPVAPEPAAAEVAVEETTDPVTTDQALPAPAAPVVTLEPMVVPCGMTTADGAAHGLIIGVDQPGTLVLVTLDDGNTLAYPVPESGTLEVPLPYTGNVNVSIPAASYNSGPIALPALDCELPEVPVDPPPAEAKAYASVEACGIAPGGEMSHIVVVQTSVAGMEATFTYSNGVVTERILNNLGRNEVLTDYVGWVRVTVPAANYDSGELELQPFTSCPGYVPPTTPTIVETCVIDEVNLQEKSQVEIAGFPAGATVVATFTNDSFTGDSSYVANEDGVVVFQTRFKGTLSLKDYPEVTEVLGDEVCKTEPPVVEPPVVEPPVVEPPAPPVVDPPVVNPPVEQPMQQPAQPPAEQPAQPTGGEPGQVPGPGAPWTGGSSLYALGLIVMVGVTSGVVSERLRRNHTE